MRRGQVVAGAQATACELQQVQSQRAHVGGGLRPGAALSSSALPSCLSRSALLHRGRLVDVFFSSSWHKDRQLESLWKDTGIGNVLPREDIADEAERLLEMRQAGQDVTKERRRMAKR